MKIEQYHSLSVCGGAFGERTFSTQLQRHGYPPMFSRSYALGVRLLRRSP